MTDPMGSHIAALHWALDLTDGPVLELGMGDFSTPFLSKMCIGRRLVSVEWNKEWFERLRMLGTPDHDIRFCQDYNVDSLPIDNFSVVLIDHEPPAEADKPMYKYQKRMDAVEFYEMRSELIIVHDTEDDWFAQSPRWREIRSKFRYWLEFRHMFPWTTILSQTIPVQNLFNTKGS